jgi:hypothetical protein
MISTGIINLLYGIVYLILYPIRLLPDVSMPSGVTSAISTVSGYMATLYAIVPVTATALLAILGLVFTAETAILTYKGIMWLVRKIPGIG